MTVPNESTKKIKEIMYFYDTYAKKYSSIINTYYAYVAKREKNGIRGPRIKISTLRELPEVPLFLLDEETAREFLNSLTKEELLETLTLIKDAINSFNYRTINEMCKFYSYDEKRRKTPKSTLWGSIDPDKSSTRVRSSKSFVNMEDL